MRWLLALAVLAACGDDFSSAQKAGTIDAFETYLTDNPAGRYVIQATAQLETLYLEEARKEASLEAYDRYLARFPKGDLRARALEEREKFLFDWAKDNGSEAAWARFLKEYPHAERKRLKTAKRMRAVASYVDKLSWTTLKIEPVNLAEDPNGPKDGFGFTMNVTNHGKKTLSDLRFTIAYLDKDGRTIDTAEWPLVAKSWGIPIEEEKKVPFKPDETREWSWATTNPSEKHWSGKVKVIPSRLQFVR